MRTHTRYNTRKQFNTEGIIFDYSLDDWQTFGAYAFIAGTCAVMASLGIYMLAVYVL